MWGCRFLLFCCHFWHIHTAFSFTHKFFFVCELFFPYFPLLLQTLLCHTKGTVSHCNQIKNPTRSNFNFQLFVMRCLWFALWGEKSCDWWKMRWSVSALACPACRESWLGGGWRILLALFSAGKWWREDWRKVCHPPCDDVLSLWSSVGGDFGWLMCLGCSRGDAYSCKPPCRINAGFNAKWDW